MDLLQTSGELRDLCVTRAWSERNKKNWNRGWTDLLRYSRLRARLFGSRPGGGLPRPATVPPAGPLDQLLPPHEFGLPDGPRDGTPFGMRESGNGESEERHELNVPLELGKRTFAPW